MESGVSQSKSKRKSETTKLIESLKRILGIQLETRDDGDNVKYISGRVMETFNSMASKIEELENQIKQIIVRSQNSESDLQKIEGQQREILTLKSSAGTRERLIRRQRRQIAELRLEIRILEQDKTDLRYQLWPEHWLEGVPLDN